MKNNNSIRIYTYRDTIHRSTNDKVLKNNQLNKRSLIIDNLKKSANPSLFDNNPIVQKREPITVAPRYRILAKIAEATPSANADDGFTANDENDNAAATTESDSAAETTTTNDQVLHKKKSRNLKKF